MRAFRALTGRWLQLVELPGTGCSHAACLLAHGMAVLSPTHADCPGGRLHSLHLWDLMQHAGMQSRTQPAPKCRKPGERQQQGVPHQHRHWGELHAGARHLARLTRAYTSALPRQGSVPDVSGVGKAPTQPTPPGRRTMRLR